MKQVGRDAMKAFICRARGIELVIIQPEDLKLKSIDSKIPGRLPRRDLEGMEPLVAALEEMAAEHRERTAEERARKGPRGRTGTQPEQTGVPANGVWLTDHVPPGYLSDWPG